MTTQQSVKSSESLDETSVERYLRDHPEFFERHQELLAILHLSHPETGKAVSLIERQVTVLREQNRGLENKLMELVEIARENERLSRQLHTFSSELLKARSLSDVIAVTQDQVRQVFQTDFVSIWLLQDITDDSDIALDKAAQQDLFKSTLDSDIPIVGRINNKQSNYLFAGNANEVASAALIPLKTNYTIGLLALASRDDQRFNPTMGHLFLSHLGDLVCSAIAVHLHQHE